MVHWMQLTAICVADSPAIVQKCPGLDRVSFWIVFALLIQDLRMESVAIYRTNSQRLFDTLLSLFWDSFGCHFCLLYYNYFFLLDHKTAVWSCLKVWWGSSWDPFWDSWRLFVRRGGHGLSDVQRFAHLKPSESHLKPSESHLKSVFPSHSRNALTGFSRDSLGTCIICSI